ncbi:MAG: NAD(P)H-binding protein [Anaerolineales bacterium]
MTQKIKWKVSKGICSTPPHSGSLVQGVDAVISVAGPPMNGKFDMEKHARATQDLVYAMKSAKVNRLITITGAGAES